MIHSIFYSTPYRYSNLLVSKKSLMKKFPYYALRELGSAAQKGQVRLVCDSETCSAVGVAEAKEAISMRFWIPMTLGVMTYFLLGLSTIHEGINIIATTLVLVGGHFLYVWMAKRLGNKE